MRQPPAALTDAFSELAAEAERWDGLRVRIERTDGSVVEGHVTSVAETDLLLRESATGRTVQLYDSDIRAVDVRLARRAREWVLAIVAIIGMPAALVGYAQLPWVGDGQGDAMIGFLLLTGVGVAVGSLPLVRNTLRAWLTNWRRLYPAPGLDEGG